MTAARLRPADATPVESASQELDLAVLTELRAALAAGVAPGPALVAAVRGGPLAPVARAVQLGRPLAEVAGTVATGDPAADLLVRALAVAERAGASPSTAVEQAARALREDAALARILRARTAQARGTAVVLAAVPLGGWVLLVGLDRAVLAFYATPIGALTAVVAVVLAALGQVWSRRIVRAAARAGRRADPLLDGPRPRVEVGPLATVAAVALVGGGLAGGMALGAVAAACAAAVAWHRGLGRPAASVPAEDGSTGGGARPDPTLGRHGTADAAGAEEEPPDRLAAGGPSGDAGGGAAEAVELVAVALASGLPPAAAVDLVATLGPPLARRPLRLAGRRLAGAWSAEAAFAGAGLERLGAVLGATERWGAPADAELRRLAADLRDERRAAVEEAAERVQLSLVFPTTLLTLPAFVLGVVPPLLWTAFA